MTDRIEAYYFEREEFRNNDNLKDVLEGMGEKTGISSPLHNEIREFAKEIQKEWSEILDRETYVLEGTVTAEYLETDEGVFIISESNILYDESRSIVSRSDKYDLTEV